MSLRGKAFSMHACSHTLTLTYYAGRQVLGVRPIKYMGTDTGIEYGPSDAGRLSEEAQQRLGVYLTKLKLFRGELPAAFQARLTDTQLKELAISLLDGTVFEITKELEDIQLLSERSLLNKRMRVVSSHKTQRVELARQQKEELAACQHKPHNQPLVKSKHEVESRELELKLSEEIRSTDQKVILELDQLVTEQQTTMLQAAVPFFAVTNKPEDIQVQIHILSFVQRLRSQTP